MRNEPTWHKQTVEQLSQIFDKEPDARAFILSGSFSTSTPQADVWSDVDVKIILADHALDRYYTSTAWLSPFGRLIELHLALDLARDGLLLQMIRCDCKKRTTIHRIGGWGNDLVTRFSLKSEARSGEEILNFVRLSCEVFDELSTDLLTGYEVRGPLLYPTIERAKEVCRDRTITGNL